MTYYSETPREGISLPDGTFKGVLKDGKPSWAHLPTSTGLYTKESFKTEKYKAKV